MTEEEIDRLNRQTFRVGDHVRIPDYAGDLDAVVTADLSYLAKSIGNLYSVHIYRDDRDGGAIDTEFLAGFLRPAPPTEP